MADNIDKIFEKHKQKLKQKKKDKEEGKILVKIISEFEENKISILNATYTFNSRTENCFSEIIMTYDTYASNENKINELIKKWRKEGLIGIVNKRNEQNIIFINFNCYN